MKPNTFWPEIEPKSSPFISTDNRDATLGAVALFTLVNEEEIAMNPERMVDTRFRAYNPMSASISRVVERALGTLLAWQQRANDRAVLGSLDDRMLRDIGCTRADVERECAKPFWKV